MRWKSGGNTDSGTQEPHENSSGHKPGWTIDHLTIQSSSSHLEKHINHWRYASNQRENDKAIKSREKCIMLSMVDKGENTYSNRDVSIPIHKVLRKVQQKNPPDTRCEIERRENVSVWKKFVKWSSLLGWLGYLCMTADFFCIKVTHVTPLPRVAEIP